MVSIELSVGTVCARCGQRSPRLLRALLPLLVRRPVDHGVAGCSAVRPKATSADHPDLPSARTRLSLNQQIARFDLVLLGCRWFSMIAQVGKANRRLSPVARIGH